MSDAAQEKSEHKGNFSELVKYTFTGYLGGLIAAAILDHFGFQKSALGSWLVRTLSGEGESIFEGIYAFRMRLKKTGGSMAEAYGIGKFLGMVAPWIIDFVSRLFGVDVSGVAGFYIPFFYAHSDQIGANIAGLIYLRKKEKNFKKALACYVRDPVMMASLAVILIVPIGLYIARSLGFRPTTQIKAALETIFANICWVPPLVGWLVERAKKRRNRQSD